MQTIVEKQECYLFLEIIFNTSPSEFQFFFFLNKMIFEFKLKEVRKQHMWVSGGGTFQGAFLLFNDARKPGGWSRECQRRAIRGEEKAGL